MFNGIFTILKSQASLGTAAMGLLYDTRCAHSMASSDSHG